MKSKLIKLGVYCSYNDSGEVNGDIEPAVVVSNRNYLIWLEKSKINPQRFNCPTCIIIKIKKKDTYYRGALINVKRRNEVNVNEILSDVKHRPHSWRKIDQERYKKFETVLYIERLKPINMPTEVAECRPPQRPIYIEFKCQD